MFGNLQAGIKPAKDLNQECRSLNTYLLPNDHPAKNILPTLFLNPYMFASSKKWEKEGFTVKLGYKIMVGFHPSLPGYVIKKFRNNVSPKKQLDNFIKRIEGAKLLKDYIAQHNFTHLTVPEKWLYKLPKCFSITGKETYVLVVENMDIFDDWDNPKGETRRLYYNMDMETVTELCITLHDVGGCDAYLKNQPFTHSGKIAFVDTEHVGVEKYHDYFKKNIVPFLNPEMQAYAVDLLQKLQEEEKKRKKL